MVDALYKVKSEQLKMQLELIKAGVLQPSHLQTKAATYGESRKLVAPGRADAVDNRHHILEKWVQAALNVVLGLRLPVDGSWTELTRAGLERFQREQGLPAHGFLDERTLRALEERVGVRAPRDGRLGGLPRLWQRDRREQERWQTRQGPPTDAPKRQGELTAPRPLDEQRRQAQLLLEREAVAAVVHRAFDRGWVREQAAEGHDAALHTQMLAWYATGQAAAAEGKPPAWLSRLPTDIGQSAERAIEVVRDAWLAEQDKR
jgi:hypothetical protein